VLQAVPAVLGIILVVFVLLQLSGDPSYILLPAESTAEQRAAFRQAYGLDRPLLIQYGTYVGHLLRGDFGQSFSFREPALQVVLRRVPATIQLTVTASLVAVLLAVPLGALAAMARGTWCDRAVMGAAVLGQSVPTFWLGMMMILLLAVRFPLLPVSGRGALAHLVMPSLALSFWLMALLARITRSEMLEVLGEDYVRTARAKGLSELLVGARHALRNAMLPVVTVMGLQFGSLLGGAVMTETVFAWPGVGTLILDSILKKDFPVVVAGVVFVAAGFILINLTLDLLYVAVDPRIRLRRWPSGK
jgi:ABC-type dipeptide/oligopeptide/nickel transport system permease component